MNDPNSIFPGHAGFLFQSFHDRQPSMNHEAEETDAGVAPITSSGYRGWLAGFFPHSSSVPVWERVNVDPRLRPHGLLTGSSRGNSTRTEQSLAGTEGADLDC
jgi:hypothetical protein